VSETKTPARQDSGKKLIHELKVSGHLMTFDTGLFCIFNAPGSAPPDPATGLPGVRVTLPPGPAFRPDAISISTFNEDGWMGGNSGAALVRVTRGPAHVLVTIYQAPNSTAEAPKLQIMRLQEAAPAPAAPAAAPVAARAPAQLAAVPPANDAPAPVPASKPAPAPGPANSPEAVKQAEVVAHIAARGDVLAKLGEWMGVPGSQRWIEGFAISPKSVIGAADIEYQAVLGRGWLSPWAEGGQFCGSRGMSLPILGMRARLRGEAADKFDCVVSASFVDGTKVGPLDNGEPAQAESLAALEAFKVELVPRDAEPAPKPKPAKAVAAPKAPPVKAPPPKPAAPAKAAAKPAPKPVPRGKK
jgi:hypothetical protein